jgi:hypothetical protein
MATAGRCTTPGRSGRTRTLGSRSDRHGFASPPASHLRSVRPSASRAPATVATGARTPLQRLATGLAPPRAGPTGRRRRRGHPAPLSRQPAPAGERKPADPKPTKHRPAIFDDQLVSTSPVPASCPPNRPRSGRRPAGPAHTPPRPAASAGRPREGKWRDSEAKFAHGSGRIPGSGCRRSQVYGPNTTKVREQIRGRPRTAPASGPVSLNCSNRQEGKTIVPTTHYIEEAELLPNGWRSSIGPHPSHRHPQEPHRPTGQRRPHPVRHLRPVGHHGTGPPGRGHRRHYHANGCHHWRPCSSSGRSGPRPCRSLPPSPRRRRATSWPSAVVDPVPPGSCIPRRAHRDLTVPARPSCSEPGWRWTGERRGPTGDR